MVESVKTGPWWSVPQAIVWIVSRSDASADDAAGIKFLSELIKLELIAKSPPDDDPPISLWYAPDALLQAAIRGEIGITGLDCGTGKRDRVRMADLIGPRWKPYEGGEAIVDNEGSAWAELWVRADECMRRWPRSVEAPVRRRGRRPDQLNAICEYLRAKYGVRGPGNTVKRENLLAELKGAKIPASLRTLGRAVTELEAN